MTIVAVCAATGSAGATTTAVALAAMLPDGYPTLLAECDPSGGDVAGWAQLSASPGWSTAVSAGDRSWAAIADNTQQLPSGLRLLAAPARATQAHTAVGEATREFAALLATAPDVVTVADCGRVGLDAPPFAVAAQLTLLLVRQSAVSAAATVPRVDRAIEALGVLRTIVPAGRCGAHRRRSIPVDGDRRGARGRAVRRHPGGRRRCGPRRRRMDAGQAGIAQSARQGGGDSRRTGCRGDLRTGPPTGPTVGRRRGRLMTRGPDPRPRRPHLAARSLALARSHGSGCAS